MNVEQINKRARLLDGLHSMECLIPPCHHEPKWIMGIDVYNTLVGDVLLDLGIPEIFVKTYRGYPVEIDYHNKGVLRLIMEVVE